jgi:hypothetical protein
MSKTATLTQSWTITGDGLSSNDSAQISNTSAVAPQSLVFAGAGFVALVIPAGALGLRITPPPTNAQTLTIKGITGDTGIQIAPASPTTLNFTGVAGPAMGIAAGGAVALLLEWC